MRIIKDGRTRTWQEECNKCHTIYEYSEKDYFEIVEEKPSGIVREEYHWFRKTEKYRGISRVKFKCLKCPQCGEIKKKVDFNNVFGEPVRWEKIER